MVVSFEFVWPLQAYKVERISFTIFNSNWLFGCFTSYWRIPNSFIVKSISIVYFPVTMFSSSSCTLLFIGALYSHISVCLGELQYDTLGFFRRKIELFTTKYIYIGIYEQMRLGSKRKYLLHIQSSLIHRKYFYENVIVIKFEI